MGASFDINACRAAQYSPLFVRLIQPSSILKLTGSINMYFSNGLDRRIIEVNWQSGLEMVIVLSGFIFGLNCVTHWPRVYDDFLGESSFIWSRSSITGKLQTTLLSFPVIDYCCSQTGEFYTRIWNKQFLYNVWYDDNFFFFCTSNTKVNTWYRVLCEIT